MCGGSKSPHIHVANWFQLCLVKSQKYVDLFFVFVCCCCCCCRCCCFVLFYFVQANGLYVYKFGFGFITYFALVESSINRGHFLFIFLLFCFVLQHKLSIQIPHVVPLGCPFKMGVLQNCYFVAWSFHHKSVSDHPST